MVAEHGVSVLYNRYDVHQGHKVEGHISEVALAADLEVD